MVGGANAEGHREAEGAGGVAMDPGPPGLRRTETWSSQSRESVAGPPGSISGASDSSAQSRSHLSSRDTEPLLTTVTHPSLHPRPPAHYLLPLCSLRVALRGANRSAQLVPRLASLAPILPVHPHLSHWDRDPETLASSTLTAVTHDSVPSNGAGWSSGHWAMNLPIPGLEGTSQNLSWLPSIQRPSRAPTHLRAGWLHQWSQEQSFCSKIHRLVEIQPWSKRQDSPNSSKRKLKPREGK